MRKYTLLKISLAVFAGISLAGCRRKRVVDDADRTPNENRGTNYDFDFADYIDISTYGADGEGKIEISRKDLDASDFKSDADYIAVMHDLDLMNLYYTEGSSDGLSVSPSSNLSNGQIVTISVDVSKSDLQSDINIEPYEYRITGLGEGTTVDLFSPDLVTFYATTDNSLFYHITNNNVVTQELADNLVYTVSSSDSKMEANKTIIHCTVSMNTDFLSANGYVSMSQYLSKHNQTATETETDLVLAEIINPIDFNSVDVAALRDALYAALGESDNMLSKICSIQQSTQYASSSPYSYSIMYVDYINGEPQYGSVSASIHYVNGVYRVMNISSRSNSIPESAMLESYNGSTVLLTFASQEEIDTLKPTPTPEDTPEPTPEATADAAETSAPAASSDSGVTAASGNAAESNNAASGTSGSSSVAEPGTTVTYDENGNQTGVYGPSDGEVVFPDITSDQYGDQG